MEVARWQSQLVASLERRDAQQSGEMAELVESRLRMARALRQVNEANAAMTLELSRLRDRTSASGAAGDAVPRLNTNGNALLEELKQQNQTYLEEVFALNKANKQLVEERRRAQEDLRRREENDIKLHDHIFSLEKQLRELQELTRNKDMATQVLHDELQALQLEVSNRDDRLRELEQSNRRLAEQWMKKLNDDTALAGSTPQLVGSAPATARPISQAPPTLVVGKPQIATVLLPKNIHKQFAIHEGDINTISCSPTGKLLASGGSDHRVRLFDALGAPKATFAGCTQGVTCVQFSRSDEWILGASGDHSTRIWATETARLRHTLSGHLGKVSAAYFAQEASIVVTGSHDRTIKLWDLQKGTGLRSIFGYSAVNDLALLDDTAATLASGHMDSRIRIWDVRTSSCQHELADVHMAQVNSLARSTDGTTLLTSARDHSLKLIDLRTYRTLVTLTAEGYRAASSRAILSPDGAYVLAGSQDGSIFAWSAATGKVEAQLKGHQTMLVGLAWNPAAGYLYSADKAQNVLIWAP